MDGTRSPGLADTCDVLVVGGGAAGCVLAARLSEDRGRRVVLLEAGPDLRADPPFDVRDASRPTMGHDWGYAEVPGPDGHARPLPRGKLLGGCSATNAVFALRGHPADYDDWARVGNPGWSFADVLPSFVRLERDTDFGDESWHGREGPLPITRIPEGELSDVARAGQESLELAGLERIPDANEPRRVGVSTLPRNTGSQSGRRRGCGGAGAWDRGTGRRGCVRDAGSPIGQHPHSDRHGGRTRRRLPHRFD